MFIKLLFTVAPAQILIAILALYFGALLPLRLPDIHPFFDRKPFNCRPCFTFHLVWLQSLVAAWLVGMWQMVAAGAVVALMIFIVVTFIDNKKVIK